MQTALRWRIALRIILGFAGVALLYASSPTVAACAATIDGPSNNITATADLTGLYTITVQDPAWTFSGDLGQPPDSRTFTAGIDRLGVYREIILDYVRGVARRVSIRTYPERPVVLFSIIYRQATRNTAPFPILTTYPSDLYHLTYTGVFGESSFNRFGIDSPWLFFDSDANAFMLSPASNFMVASTSRGIDEEIISGIHPGIDSLPSGFIHQTLLVVEKGINKAFEAWGQALTDLQGKTRPENDVDLGLAYLGYWTDNGATYYYQFESALGYEGTLLAVRDDFARQGIPLGYMQLDSWFYPKGLTADWRNRLGGIYRYVAHPFLFPEGLKAFQQQLGLPLITHARWIDPFSPYRQEYQISEGAPTDPAYWDDIIDYLQDAGVVTYEQDWLGFQATTAFNLEDPEAFMGNMARASSERELTIQYCLARPRHYLQSSKYDNVTTIRTSDDRFTRARWDEFLYGSRLASALGVWPWSDVFMSTELENLLLSTLSAGPVGVGDRIGSLSRANLLRAVRGDGVIVKPDVPIVPIDASLINDAQGLMRPMVAATYTDFGAFKAVYLFAYNRGLDTTTTFRPAALGLTGPVFVYNYFTDSGQVVDSEETFREPMTNGRAYYIVVPVGDSGIGFLGDAGQFVSLGKKRITHVVDDGVVEATVAFAEGESARTLYGYAPAVPTVTAVKGTAGPPDYDPAKQLFRVAVAPDVDGSAVVEIKLPDKVLR